jgi:hypothetical protein
MDAGGVLCAAKKAQPLARSQTMPKAAERQTVRRMVNEDFQRCQSMMFLAPVGGAPLPALVL